MKTSAGGVILLFKKSSFDPPAGQAPSLKLSGIALLGFQEVPDDLHIQGSKHGITNSSSN